jgi:hypothetical protein
VTKDEWENRTILQGNDVHRFFNALRAGELDGLIGQLDREVAERKHIVALRQAKNEIDRLIVNVDKLVADHERSGFSDGVGNKAIELHAKLRHAIKNDPDNDRLYESMDRLLQGVFGLANMEPYREYYAKQTKESA